MNLAWRTDLATGPKFVLVMICDSASEQGFCWPSVPTIAKRCSMGQRTVHGHLQELEALGVISRRIRRGQNTHYYVHPAKFPMQPEVVEESTTAKSAVPRDVAAEGSCTTAESAPPQNSGPTPADSVAEPPQNSTVTPAESATITTSNHKKNRKEPKNSGAALPRVCVSLPEWLPAEAWERLATFRMELEAEGGAPWTQTLADVTLLTLEQRRAEGHDPVACINASILGGWSGIYPPRKVAAAHAASAPGAPVVPADWHTTLSGIVAFGAQQGIVQREHEKDGIGLERFKAKVFKAAGPGEWQEAMLRVVTRESAERGAALLAFFNDLLRPTVALQAA